MTEILAEALAARSFTALENHPAGVRLVVGFGSQAEALAAQAAVTAIPQRPRSDASTAAELIAALKAAKPGQTITLAPGTYAKVYLKGHILPDVTITGRDAALTDLTVHSCQGITFSDLEFISLPGGVENPFIVRGSKDIHFKRCDFHGTLDDNPQNDQSGLMIRESERTSVTGSEFHELFIALSHLDCDHLVVTGNRFHDLQMDGCRGGGSSNVLIAKNHFTDFYPKAGNHPDAIQLWGDKTEEAAVGDQMLKSATDIVITGNVIVRGAGEKFQGIFVRDGTGLYPFIRVEITDNIVLGGMYAGIAVDNGQDVTITGNTVAGFPDMYSSIRTLNVTGLKVADNRAQKFLAAGKLVKAPADGNTLVPAQTDGGAALLAALATKA